MHERKFAFWGIGAPNFYEKFKTCGKEANTSQGSRCKTLPEIMHERKFAFLDFRGQNWAQFYEKFKIYNEVAHASQGSYLKVLDAKLWLK